jgi:hypothetical protein
MDFVGNKLFEPSNFNFYDRLSIGTYNELAANIEELDFFDSYKDVQNYVSLVNQGKKTSVLRRQIFA